MNRMILVLFGAVVMVNAAPSVAGIPEPDAVLFGHVCLGNGSATDQSNLTVIAKADVGGTVTEVGRYQMGDLASANDCDGDTDCYVLRVRLESVPTDTTAGGNAVVIAKGTVPQIQVFVIDGENPEVMVAEVGVTRGMIQNLNLRTSPPTADLNGDGQNNLLDHQVFVASLQGPAVTASPPCNPADQNGDGYVDLRDAAILQRAHGN